MLKIFKDFNDKNHRLKLLERQIEYGKFSDTKSLKKIMLSNEKDYEKSIYATYKSGIGWVDALNGSVRPILAYSFFLMYAGVKVVQYLAINASSEPLIAHVDIIWNVDDEAIFASIISFYFGQRTFDKIWKRKS